MAGFWIPRSNISVSDADGFTSSSNLKISNRGGNTGAIGIGVGVAIGAGLGVGVVIGVGCGAGLGAGVSGGFSIVGGLLLSF